MAEANAKPRRRWVRILVSGLVVIALLSLIGSMMIRPSFGDYSSSPQWRDGRFASPRAPGPGDMPESTIKVWWEVFVNKPAGTLPDGPLPIHALTHAELDDAPDRSLYRLGHSTVLMKLRGQWYITDPVFANRASPVQFAGPKRFHPSPIALEDLPPIRAVLLSHDHYDHLDRSSIRYLRDKAELFIMPLGVGDRLARWGVDRDRIRQLDWWDDIEVEGLTFTAAPGQHFSGRGFFDGNRTLWASWGIRDGDFNLFYSGDTGYYDGLAEIGERLGPFDLTVIEAGAYNEQWRYVHLLPDQVVQLHQDVRGGWLLPVHNGTFDLAMHAWQEPFEEVLRIATERGVQVATPMFGERFNMDAPQEGARWWRAP